MGYPPYYSMTVHVVPAELVARSRHAYCYVLQYCRSIVNCELCCADCRPFSIQNNIEQNSRPQRKAQTRMNYSDILVQDI